MADAGDLLFLLYLAFDTVHTDGMLTVWRGVQFAKIDDSASVINGWSWTFAKRVVPALDEATGQSVWPSIVFQIVVLDDLIPQDDQRVNVASGADRRNLVNP